MKVIEECTEVNWQEREIYWINYYRQSCNLCNHHDGGLGCSGRIISQEERLRLKKLGQAQSYFSEEEKVLIWKLIQENYSFEEIKIKYPKLPKVSYNAVKTGRLWKHITNLTPPPKQKAIRIGKDCKKSKPVICTKTNIVYESARQAWLLLYADKYKYNYIICMLRGHNKNVTSLVYLT